MNIAFIVKVVINGGTVFLVYLSQATKMIKIFAVYNKLLI